MPYRPPNCRAAGMTACHDIGRSPAQVDDSVAALVIRDWEIPRQPSYASTPQAETQPHTPGQCRILKQLLALPALRRTPSTLEALDQKAERGRLAVSIACKGPGIRKDWPISCVLTELPCKRRRLVY